MSLRNDCRAHGFMYFCQVSRKSVKRKWLNGCVVFITKKVGILLRCLWFLERSRQKITGSLFPHSPSLCQVLSTSVQFSRRYTRKCLPDSPTKRNYNKNRLMRGLESVKSVWSVGSKTVYLDKDLWNKWPKCWALNERMHDITACTTLLSSAVMRSVH